MCLYYVNLPTNLSRLASTAAPTNPRFSCWSILTFELRVKHLSDESRLLGNLLLALMRV